MYKFFQVLFLNLIVICPAYSNSIIEISDPWINEAPPAVKVLAGYMMIRNNTDDSVNLTTVTSSRFERVEFHLTTMKDGVASMEKQDEVIIPARSEFRFSPGEYHLMLFNPSQAVKNGDNIPLELSFSNGLNINIEAEVKRNGSDDHHHH